MRKVFVEPEMKKIELNLSENIATSKVIEEGFIFYYQWDSCTLQETGKTLEEATFAEMKTCKVKEGEKILGGTVVSEEIVRMHMK